VHRHGQTRPFGQVEIVALCQQGIADRCPTFRANVPADRVRGNPCVRNSRARAERGLARNLRALLSTAAVRCRPEHGPGRARLDVQECCRHCLTKCR
jgi:hypothetical protein